MTFNRGFPETSGSLDSLPIRQNFEHFLDTIITHVSGSNAHNADAINIDVIGSPTINNVELMHSNILSAGTLCTDLITDAGDNTITVSSGSGFIRTSDLHNAPLISFEWASSSSIGISDDLLTYIYIDYNGGNPIITITADRNDINDNSQLCIGHVFRESGSLTIHTRTGGLNTCDIPRRVDRRIKDLRNFERSSGMVTSETGVRNISVTAGEGWRGLDTITTLAKNTSGSGDTFNYWNRDGGGGWTEVSGSVQIDNINYDDGSGTLQALSTNKYGVHWVFLCADGHIDIVYGQGDYKLAEAQNAEVPILPVKINEFDLIVARIIIEKNAVTFTEVVTAFETFFPRSEVINHNDLGNIDGGKVDEYYHLENVEHDALVGGGTSDADAYHVHPDSGSADTLDSVCDRGATTDQPITVTGSGSVFNSLKIENDLHVYNNAIIEGDVQTQDLVLNQNTGDNDAVITFNNALGNETLTFHKGAGDRYFHFSSELMVDLELFVNGNIRINFANDDAHAILYFCKPGAGSTTLRWDKTDERFEFSEKLFVNGSIEAVGSGSVFKSLRIQNDLHIGGDLEVDDNAVVDGYITVLSSGSVVKSLRVQNDLKVGGDLDGDHNTLANLQGGKASEYYHLENAEHGALVDGGSADGYHIHPSSGSGNGADTLDDVCERGAETDVAITVTASGSVFKSLRVQNDLHVGNDLEVDDNVVVDGTMTVLSSGSVLNSLKVDNNVHVYGDLIVEGGIGVSITATIIFPIQSAKISGGFVADPARIDGGSGAWKLLFSATQTESAVWLFRMPQDYASGLTAKLIYTMASAVEDKVDMEVEIMALSDGESDPDVASFDAVNEVAGGTTVPDTAGKIDEISIVCSNDDGVVANDLVIIRVNRDHDDPDDTATGDLELRALSLEYTTS